MGLIGSIFGGGTGAYKKGVRDLQSARDKELAHWEKLAYGDPLQSSENQAALRQARELLKGNINRAAGAAALTGATDESVALQKAAANESLEDITADIAANSTQQKNAAMQNYLAANRSYTDAINNIRVQQSQAEAQALQGLIGAGTSIATAGISAGLFGGKK